MTITSYAFQEIRPVRNWIGGEWHDAASGKTLPVMNPRYDKAMTTVAMSGKEDVEAAVKAASAAFPGWAAVPIKERAQVFYQLKYLMEKHIEELAWLVSHENGKTFEEGKASVAKTVECIEFGCSLPNIPDNNTLYVSRGVTCSLQREPIGVCAGIVPVNFPLMVPMWMLPQAIVGGNTFILKPSEQVPASSMRLAELFREAGLPDGVFNVVNGGAEAVEALVDHPTIKAMGFVGSSKIAKMLYARGAQLGRKMLCLGSAKNHLIVVPDADVEMTSVDVVRSFAGMAGQRCMAATTMVGVGNIDKIMSEVIRRASAIRTGVDMGPLVNKGSLERILRIIDDSVKAGAKILLDGRGVKVEDAPNGYWLGPTILEVTPDMPAYKEEIFGPVLCVVRTKTLDEALAVENSNPYGNGGSIYTTSGATARYAAQRINAGMTGINIGIPVPREPFGFGGWEESKYGHGDITGIEGYHFWTRPRKLTIKWGLQPDATWMS